MTSAGDVGSEWLTIHARAGGEHGGIVGGERRLRVLFVCDQNRLRSRTAQALFDDDPRLDVMSAGVRRGAVVVVTHELLEWADVIFVMERSQRNLIRKRFEDLYQRKRIVCLNIPDEYDLMDPVLIGILRRRVPPHLRDVEPGSSGSEGQAP